MSIIESSRAATAVDRWIGANMRARRIELDIAQEKLAELVGVTFQQIQKYESGFNRCSASRLWEIAKVLDLPIQDFFVRPKASASIGKRPAKRVQR